MSKESKHPKIFSDLVLLFELYYRIHEGMPKSFRVSVSDKVLNELTEAMRLAVLANSVDKKSKDGREQGALYISQLRGHIEVAWTFVLLGWKLRFVSNGAMANMSQRFENIAPQAVNWERWFNGK